MLETIKRILSFCAIIGISLILISWGGTGHRIISYNSALSFNSEMSNFSSWIEYIRDHASDADNRKSSDPTEGPKHYLDIDNIPEFISTGKINQDSYTSTSNGILPWATIAAFDSLTNCLKRNDIAKAKQFAADLGHYVGDGHMPLHITKNYDGQLTGNSGIHSRYETTMINAYYSLITYNGDNLSVISDVNHYVFNYIYKNYTYKDSILLADTYAKTAGSVGSAAYNTALWNETKDITTTLFKNASHALAELMYTALVRSGITTDVPNQNLLFTETLEQNTPNPFTTHTTIRYNLAENSDITLQIKDILGNNIATLFKGYQAAGSYSVDWYPQNQPEGIYFIAIDTRKIHQVKKMILVK